MEDIRFLPNNFAELSSIVKLSANAKFEKVKPWGKKKNYNDLDEKELEDPEVYFTFSVSWDIEPEEIVEKVVMQELRRGGEGNKIEVSELRYLKTLPTTMFYNMSNEGTQANARDR